MPQYEFKCEQCKAEFELTMNIRELQLPPCPICNSPNTKKLISKSSVQFKGPGWTPRHYDRFGSGK